MKNFVFMLLTLLLCKTTGFANQVINTIDLGTGNRPGNCAISADGNTLYTANTTSTVSVIDTTAQSLTTNVSLSHPARFVVLSPNGSQLWTAGAPFLSMGFLSVINTSNNTIVAPSPIALTDVNPRRGVFGLAGTPSADRFYGSLSNAPGTVDVINTSTLAAPIASPTVQDSPRDLCIRSDGASVYVANRSSNSVSVIDTSSNLVSTTISVGNTPVGLECAIVPGLGEFAYTANSFSNDVSVINMQTNMVTATISVGTTPEMISISNDGLFAYAVNSGSNDISKIDLLTNTVVGVAPVGIMPRHIAVSPNGEVVCTANTGSDDVSIVNTSNMILEATLPVGEFPFDLCFSPDSAHLYVGNLNGESVSIIQITTSGGGEGANGSKEGIIVSGKSVKDAFLLSTDVINALSWTAPKEGEQPDFYQIFRGSKLLGEVPASKPYFEDHNLKKGRTYTYEILGVRAYRRGD